MNESPYTDPRAAHAPGVRVSFDRPYGKYVQIFDNPQSMGSGEFLLWEYPLCYWLEKEGYDVTCCSSLGNLDPANLSRAKTMTSVGHDEYWDIRQFQNVKQAIASGLSVLWLSANDVYMVTPFTANARGEPNRRLTRETCYGEFRKEEKTRTPKSSATSRIQARMRERSSAPAPSSPSTAAATGPVPCPVTGSSPAPA